MKRKIILCVSLFLMLLTLFALSINAAEPVETWDISATSNDNVTATLYDDGSFVMSGTGKMKDWTDYPYSPWYSSYRDKIKSVTIEDGVTNIGAYAFRICYSLTSIVIPDSVTIIGDGALDGCRFLPSIVIPDSVTTIGKYAFYDCDSVPSIVIPDSVTSVGDEAFAYSASLTIYCEAKSKPSGWNSKWNYLSGPVVWNCNNNDVATDGNIYTVIDGIRYGINGIATVETQLVSIKKATIPESIEYKGTVYRVTSISDNAFKVCKSLKSIEIPNSVTSIGEYAFYECTALTRVVIPDSVTSIGEDAFYRCVSLKSIVIPNSVRTIGIYAFRNCSSLTIYAEATSKPGGWNSSWNYSSCPVVWDYKNTIRGQVFTFKGYSFNEAGSMAVGFDIDYEAKALYEELTGETLEIGVVFAGYSLLNGNQPLDNEGNAITLPDGAVVKFDLTEYDYTYYDFVITDIIDGIKDIPLVISAYINNGEENKYVQENGISDTVTGISYNEAKN